MNENLIQQLNRNIECAGGHWLWRGALDEKGYAKATIGGKVVKVHRFTYQLFMGETDLQMNHICEHRNCVCPWHLYAGTQKQNGRDRTLSTYFQLNTKEQQAVGNCSLSLRAAGRVANIHHATVKRIREALYG